MIWNNFFDNIYQLLKYNVKAPMLFNSGTFLLLFLVFLFVYIFIHKRKTAVSIFVIAFSLYFYYKSSGLYFLILVFTAITDYSFALLIHREEKKGLRKLWLWLSVGVSLGILAFFKYTNFILDNFATILEQFAHLQSIAEYLRHQPDVFGQSMQEIINGNFQPLDIFLPIGISFYTFQSISYVLDVYWKKLEPTRNFLDYAFFLSFFPQLVAGPIVKAHHFLPQLKKEITITRSAVYAGMWLIIIGLIKKALIADYISQYNDLVFADPTHYSGFENLMAVYGYTLQIYLDFSGYSDMAIGLGRMFGFHFLENFNYPYVSRSIKEFWRRWHISLSNWFRDYLYIPLGGNRRGKYRTAANLVLVFLLCGLWHGANWNFLLWGLIYGCFLVAERGKFGTVLKALPRWIQHGYVLLVVVNTWVFFRIDTVKGIGKYLAAMYGNADAQSIYPLIAIRIDLLFVITLSMGILFSMPTYPYIRDTVSTVGGRFRGAEVLFAAAKLVVLGILFFWSAAQLAVGSYNPFIYFRF